MIKEKLNKHYGKRSVRFWVTVYLTTGTVLYVAAYLLFAHHSGAGTTGPGLGY